MTHKALLGWALTSAVIIATAAWTVTSSAAGDAKEAASEAVRTSAASVQALKVEVQENKKAADASASELRGDVQAVYKYLVTRRRQTRLEDPEAAVVEPAP